MPVGAAVTNVGHDEQSNLRVAPKHTELLGNQAYSERERDHITHTFAGATRFSMILPAKSKALFLSNADVSFMPRHAALTSSSPFPNKASTKSSA